MAGLPRFLKRLVHATFWFVIKASVWIAALLLVLAIAQSIAPAYKDRAVVLGTVALLLVLLFLAIKWLGNIFGRLARYAQCPDCGKCQTPPATSDTHLVRWQHTRKDGGRDLRFARNKALVEHRNTYACSRCSSRWARRWQSWERGHYRETVQERQDKAVAKRRVMRMIKRNLKQ